MNNRKINVAIIDDEETGVEWAKASLLCGVKTGDFTSQELLELAESYFDIHIFSDPFVFLNAYLEKRNNYEPFVDIAIIDASFPMPDVKQVDNELLKELGKTGSLNPDTLGILLYSYLSKENEMGSYEGKIGLHLFSGNVRATSVALALYQEDLKANLSVKIQDKGRGHEALALAIPGSLKEVSKRYFLKMDNSSKKHIRTLLEKASDDRKILESIVVVGNEVIEIKSLLLFSIESWDTNNAAPVFPNIEPVLTELLEFKNPDNRFLPNGIWKTSEDGSENYMVSALKETLRNTSWIKHINTTAVRFILEFCAMTELSHQERSKYNFKNQIGSFDCIRFQGADIRNNEIFRERFFNALIARRVIVALVRLRDMPTKIIFKKLIADDYSDYLISEVLNKLKNSKDSEVIFKQDINRRLGLCKASYSSVQRVSTVMPFIHESEVEWLDLMLPVFVGKIGNLDWEWDE